MLSDIERQALVLDTEPWMLLRPSVDGLTGAWLERALSPPTSHPFQRGTH